MSTEFFKCFSGEKEAKEFEDHEQRGLPVASTIFQVPVRYLTVSGTKDCEIPHRDLKYCLLPVQYFRSL